MNVLVVGGAGYVGCVLVRELMNRGHKVRVLDRLYFGNNLGDDVDLWVGDMREPPTWIFDGMDAVINVGGLSNDPTAEYNVEANQSMNLHATRSLAEAAIRAGVKRFVFASSASVYDTGIISDEADDIVQDEDTPIPVPTKPYSRSKFDAERVLLAMAGEDFSPVILRKGTIFGWSPRMRYDLVVNSFVKDALSKGIITVFAGGEMWRPLVAVRDVARAYATVVKAPDEKVSGQIFNISRRNYRISELALWVQYVLAKMGVHIKINVAYTRQGVRSYRISNQKFKQALGFEYHHDIEHAVNEMVKKVPRDFENPIYYNIDWMQFLEKAKDVIDVTGRVF